MGRSWTCEQICESSPTRTFALPTGWFFRAGFSYGVHNSTKPLSILGLPSGYLTFRHGKIHHAINRSTIYFYGPSKSHGYVSHNQMVNPMIIPFFTIVNPLLNHEKSPFIVVKYPIRSHVNPMYHLVMTNIAIENPPIF